LAILEIVLCSVIFFALMKYLGPIKKAAKAKEAEEEALVSAEPKDQA
jgi:uncharacterized membrane protein